MSKSIKPKATPKEAIVKDVPKEAENPKMVVDENGKVKIKATKKAPFHKEGEMLEVREFLAVKMVTNGWAELIK